MRRMIIGAVLLLVWASAACVIAQEDAPPARPDVVPTVPGSTVRPTVPQPPAPRTADVPKSPAAQPEVVQPGPMQADAPQAEADSSAPGPVSEPGYLGVIGDDRQDRGRGVRVVEVRPGGPANLAGLLPGDLIVGVSGIRIRQMSDMVAVIRQARPGTTLALDVQRNNERRNVHVTLAHRPIVEPDTAATGAPAGNPSNTRLPSQPPDPFRLDVPPIPPKPATDSVRPDGPPLPPKSTEDSARLELLEQRLDRLETRMEKMERAMLDLLKALKSR